MSEGVSLNMMNRKSTRILITLVLAAAICSALGSEAHAAWNTRSLTTRVTLSSQAPKPVFRPYSGEPDGGAGGAPQPPKAGSYPTTGQLATWTQRIQWMIRIWLGTVPKRFP